MLCSYDINLCIKLQPNHFKHKACILNNIELFVSKKLINFQHERFKFTRKIIFDKRCYFMTENIIICRGLGVCVWGGGGCVVIYVVH